MKVHREPYYIPPLQNHCAAPPILDSSRDQRTRSTYFENPFRPDCLSPTGAHGARTFRSPVNLFDHYFQDGEAWHASVLPRRQLRAILSANGRRLAAGAWRLGIAASPGYATWL